MVSLILPPLQLPVDLHKLSCYCLRALYGLWLRLVCNVPTNVRCQCCLPLLNSIFPVPVSERGGETCVNAVMIITSVVTGLMLRICSLPASEVTIVVDTRTQLTHMTTGP
ncbi:hypothetical protein BaRGS_00036418 [Batillaria attramentaria]|uniref:Uncharacterized protein n=1 Tax=Batillaria attramentaria TaxID=370345 RepID=A0ABD0JBV2_9CAEN